jgi:hypothetical protein
MTPPPVPDPTFEPDDGARASGAEPDAEPVRDEPVRDEPVPDEEDAALAAELTELEAAVAEAAADLRAIDTDG